MSAGQSAMGWHVRVAMSRLLLWAVLASATASAWAEERLTVPSLDGAPSAPVQMPAHWFAAPGEANAPKPAMVLLHGCGGPYSNSDVARGLSERMREYAAWLNARGVHVLVTDSLTPRGETELCTQRTGSRAVTQTQRRRDALGALRWLAERPGVDRQRLGLMGWSNGGSTVLAATNLRQREVQQAAAVPSLAVAYYAGCETDRKRGYEASAPLLLLVGEADDWTPASHCKQLANEATGAKVSLHAFAEAHHGFDGTGPVRHLPKVPNGAQPGQGVHAGGNLAARAAAFEALDAFLRQRWAL